MPSKNPLTGRRLSGNAQRQRGRLVAVRAAFAAAEQAPGESPGVPAAQNSMAIIDDGSEPPAPPFADLPPPPLTDGVAACETWAAKVAMVCAARIDAGREPERVMLLSACCKRLGQLAPKAQRSEGAAYLHTQALGCPVDLLSDDPPLSQPLCGVAWVFFRLVRLTDRILRADAHIDPQHLLLVLNVLTVAGYLSCKGELRRLLDQVKEQPRPCRP